MDIENDILSKAVGGQLPPVSSLVKGVVLMYLTFDDLLAFVFLIIAIITLVISIYDKHKK